MDRCNMCNAESTFDCDCGRRLRCFRIIAQVNDVGGSLTRVGDIFAHRWQEAKDEARDLVCQAESEPEIIDAWAWEIGPDGEELMDPENPDKLWVGVIFE